MEFYDRNISAIRTTREYLHNKMQECDLSVLEDETNIIKSVETKDGNLAIVLEKENSVYRLNSAYKPVAEAMKWVEQFQFHNLNIIVSMFGLGNGIFAREVMKNLGEQDMLFILEPSVDIFLHTLHHYDITDILSEGKVSISIEGINEQEFVTLLNQCVTWTNLESQIKCIHPQYDKVFNESYNGFMKNLKNVEIRAIVNKNTEAYWGVVMTKNEIRNLIYLKKCNILSDFINDIPKNIPAIIVSAGPSLDKNIEELKKAKGRAVIIAADTALKFLLAHNIIPDFVVTLDATKSISHFSDERFKQIPLLCKTVSNPAVLDLHAGKKVFFYNEQFVDTIFKNLDKIQTYYSIGGCVSTAAFSICVGLGFDRIVLIGQDLCYNGEITHAGGTILNAHGSGEGATMMVEDIYGNMVKARYDWYTYLLWFQDAIAICPHIDVIDATEGGAKINGAKIMTLSDVIERYCVNEINIEKIVREKPSTFNKDELVLVREYFKQSLHDLNIIETNSKESINICNRLIMSAEKSTIGSNTSQGLVKKLSIYNKEIADKSIYQILNDYIANVTTKQLDNINQFTDDKKNNQIKTYTKSREVYKAIYNGIQEIKPLLEQSLLEFDQI